MATRSDRIPEFLNRKLFEEVLQQSYQQNSIDELKITPDLTGGNYSSNIYRVKVVYKNKKNESKTLNLFVKALHEIMCDNSREFFMYETVLPKMQSYLREAGVEYANLAPRVYLSRKTKYELHIFEDLNSRGYKLRDRFIGYNSDQARLLFKKLGAYHAASIIYKEKYPKVVGEMKEFFCKSDENFMSFVENIMKENIEYICNIMESWSDEYKTITSKLKLNTGNKFKHKFLKVLEKEDAKVRVLAHGDLWIKNILLLEDENNKVLDAVFLDYQNCFDGSPAFDIVNLFLTSLEFDVLKTQTSALLECYHRSLSEALKKLNYPVEQIPSLNDIKEEIHRIAYFTFYVLIFSFTQTNLSEELSKGMDYSDFFDAERMKINRNDIFSNQRVLETLKYELKRLNDLNIFD